MIKLALFMAIVPLIGAATHSQCNVSSALDEHQTSMEELTSNLQSNFTKEKAALTSSFTKLKVTVLIHKAVYSFSCFFLEVQQSNCPNFNLLLVVTSKNLACVCNECL